MWTIAGTRHINPGTIPPDDPVTHGSQITAANTGPRIATTAFTADTGNTNMTQAWLNTFNGGSNVISGWRIEDIGWAFASFSTTITGKKVTFTDCEFIGVGETNGTVWVNTQIVDDDIDPGFRVVFDHCSFDGDGEVDGNTEACIIGGQWTATRCKATNMSGLYRGTSDNIEVTECWLNQLADIDLAENPNPHTSWLGFNAGSHILIQRNWVRCGTGDNLGASGAIVCYGRQNAALNSDVVIKDNAAQGGGYVYYCGSAGSGIVEDCHWTGNIFYRDDFRLSGAFGTNTTFDTEGGSNSFTGNTWGPPGPFFVSGDAAEGDPAEAQ